MSEPITVIVSKESYAGTQQPVLPKLWSLVSFGGRNGIVYRIKATIDEDGPAHLVQIKGWKLYKQSWRNNLKLWWLKTRVKYNWI